MGNFAKSLLASSLCALSLVLPVKAMSDTPKIGIVIMHGKGGSPTKTVSELAGALEKKGYLVANLEMPWSGNREYDASVTAAEEQVEAALSSLRGKGAQKVFVAGHSQGGVFTLHFAGKHIVDGIICIAPGGSVASKVFREKLGNSMARARQMVADGKGDEKSQFEDYE
ncbi:MAG TPA: alpha/beta hydrolase, partial [Sulfuricaulis sp.]